MMVTDSEQPENEQNILIQLQNRLDGMSKNIMKMEEELVELEVNATDNIELINQRCDNVLQIIENYRQSLLKNVGKLKNEKKQELNSKLKTLKSIHNIALQTTNKCEKYVSNLTNNNNNNMNYALLYLNKVINEGNQQEEQLNIHKIKAITGIKNKTININFTKLMQTQLKFKIHFDANLIKNIYFNNEKQINIGISTRFKHQVLIEHWFRIALQLQLPADIMNLIKDLSGSLLKDRFDLSINYKSIKLYDNIAEREEESEGYESIFGSVIATPGCIYKWRIKIINKIDLNIGIIESEKCEKYVTLQWWLSNIGYAYYCQDGNFYHKDDATFGGMKEYGESYDKNDIIDVCLDLKQNTISFAKNNHFYCDQNVKDNINYRLAIAIFGGSIQLISSTIT